jgi:hypothetical protein
VSGRGPDFDELVGTEVTGDERAQLQRAHELLLAAGPPPELPPHLEGGPTLAMTLARPPRQRRSRIVLLAAAIVVLGLAFLGGYVSGSHNGGGSAAAPAGSTLQLRGTSAAPNALASLQVEPADPAGNWPMTLSVTGLPTLPAHGYYAVYLVRNGKPWEPCGWFRVGKVTDSGVTVSLNAPYDLRSGDSWIVTEQLPGTSGPGETVLEPFA